MAMKLAGGREIGTVAITAALLLAAGAVIWYFERGPHDEFATLRGHRDGVLSLAIAPANSNIVATGGGDGTVRLWDVAKQRQKAVLKGHTDRVLALAWSPDGTLLASGGADRAIHIWNPQSGEQIARLKNIARPVRALAFSSDGKMMAAGVDTELYVWPVENSKELKILSGHKQDISGLAFLPGKNELASFASDKTVRIWDLAKMREVASMPGPFGHCYGSVLSPDGKMMACIGGGRVHLYDLLRRQALDPIEPNAHILCGAAFSPDGRTLAIGSQDKVIVIWDLAEKKERARLNGHQYAVASMAFLPDGKTLVTSSYDSTLKLWRVN
jgi:WD40 repeat protein